MMAKEQSIEQKAPLEDAEGQEENIERTYELRNLRDKDLFPLLNILKKVGIKDFKKAFRQEEADKKETNGEQAESVENVIKNIGISVAIDIVDLLIRNLGNVEDEVYTLWSDISGIPVDEMKEMEFGTLPLMIADTFSQAKNTSFFRVLSKFLS